MTDDTATVVWRLAHLERTVAALEAKVDRLVWALTTTALSFTGLAVALVLTFIAAKT